MAKPDALYTAEQIAFLRANALADTASLMPMFPGKTIEAVSKKRRKLGIGPRQTEAEITGWSREWTAEELRILRDNDDLSAGLLTPLLPSRTAKAITRKRFDLGIKEPPEPRKIVVSTHWSDAEIAIVREHASEPTEQFLHMLPSRSYGAIEAKRKMLGLRFVAVMTAWTQAEDTVIREHRGWSSRELLPLLPGRTRTMIVARQKALTPKTPQAIVERQARDSAGKVSAKAAEHRAVPRPPTPPPGSITNGPSGIEREWFEDGSCLPYLKCLGPRAIRASAPSPAPDALTRHLGEPVAVSG